MKKLLGILMMTPLVIIVVSTLVLTSYVLFMDGFRVGLTILGVIVALGTIIVLFLKGSEYL